MRINVAVPETHITAPVLDAALEGVTRLNEQLIKSGAAPLFDRDNPQARWKPEPPGQEHFDHAGIVHGRGWGDCDDLAPWHAAGLRVTGEDPGARAIVKRSGKKRWHALVRRSDGSIDDPSLDAGMPGPGRRVGINGAVVPVMFAPDHRSQVSGTYIARPHLALRPVADRMGQVEAWQARADLPWHWQPGNSPGDVAMVSLHASPVSDQAIVGACRGAVMLGEASGFIDGHHLDRMDAIADACEGAAWEELAEDYGPEHADAAAQVVVGLFGGLKKWKKRLVKAANPFDLAKSAVKFVPGVGPMAAKGMGAFMPTTSNLLKYAPMAAKFVPGIGPVASMALQHATPMLQRSLLDQRTVRPSQRGRPGLAAMSTPGGMNLRCVPFS